MPPKPPTKDAVEKLHVAFLKHHGNKSAAARECGLSRATYRDQLDIGARLYGLAIPDAPPPEAKGRRYLEVADGVIYVAGDAHYWPGPPSTAHKAFVKFLAREKNLVACVLNGDAYDFPGISRWDIDWTSIPEVKDEIETVEDRLTEIVKASKKAKRYFPLGNHDARFEKYLAKNAPHMKGVAGTSLVDFNPLWEPCWSLHVNHGPGGVMIKHRPPKGGIHSTSNSTLWAGITTVCNHLHSLQCRPHTDFLGTRWGVDAGCLADTFGPQFSYLEDNPRSWRAGFVRLKWVEGKLLTPELIRVVEPDVVEFRGELIEV